MSVSEEFSRVLEQLVQGNPSEADLYKLSNLHGPELAQLAQWWPDLSDERREALIARMVEIGEDDFEVDYSEVFKISLNDSSPRVRTSAVEGLWEVEDVTMVRPLIQLLRSDPFAIVREAAAMSLSRFVLLSELDRLPARLSEMVWDVLWATAHDKGEDLAVRRRAIESLAYFDRPEVTQLITQAYEDEEPKMRVSAVFAMGRSGNDEWTNTVLDELESTDPEMRYEATRAAGDLRLIEATQVLSLLVADQDAEVRTAAVWSLGQIGTPEARRVLEICYEEGDEVLQDAAAEALEEMNFMQGELDFSLYDFPGNLDEDELEKDEDDLD